MPDPGGLAGSLDGDVPGAVNGSSGTWGACRGPEQFFTSISEWRVRFVIDSGQPPLDGLLHYIEDEHSFMFEAASPQDLFDRTGIAGLTSLSIGTLQVEVGVSTGQVLFAWGLHPKSTWRASPVPPPVATPGAVTVVDAAFVRGVSVQIATVGAWATCFDESTGWIRVAPTEGTSESYSLVATGTVVGVSAGRLDSVWLQPIFT